MTDCGNSCRPPDGYYGRNYCLMEKNKKKMIDCASKYTSTSEDQYYDNFKCEEGYVQVYYECIDKKLVANSAMYFSNVYSFPNIFNK